MAKIRLLSSASFRLTSLYLGLFAISALAVGSFVYVFILRSQERAFAERIEEETDALARLGRTEGRARLTANIEARSVGGGSLVYGLYGSDGVRLAGRSPVTWSKPHSGWSEGPEADEVEIEEDEPDIVRMLTTQLADGAFLVVGDERTAVDKVMHDITRAFLWALGVALALGLGGGLWLSRHFLSRLDTMRNTAHAIMDGDWRRRIPVSIFDDDLTAVARTFNRLFERIEKLLLAQKQVGSDIAHDLRRPLAKVSRDLERAKGSGDFEAIEHAAAGVEEVLQTFDALLRIGEIESGARRAAFASIDLAELTSDVVEAFRPSAEDEHRALTTRLESPLPMQGDAALLKQAIANLIDNALRHTAPGVAVDVVAKRMADGVQLEVVDRGQGVPEADRAQLFQRFFRADAARQSAGTGLGLALVAAIADLHDMEVVASDNAPGLRVILRSIAHV